MNKSMNEKHVALTERIIAELERGCAPWVQPWSGPSLPYNIAGKRSYRGINVLARWTAQREFEYLTCEWLSFRQALELGGNVRKGEHGFPVFFYRVLEREDKDAKDGMRRIPMLRTYTTFNVAQCENLPARELTERHQGERLSDAEDFIAAIGAKISHGGDRAYYKHETDEIVLPDRERFESSEFYVSTVLHECAHWAGVKHRLARDSGKRFGDAAYAFEELVAELTSAYLCAELEIPGMLRHPEYLAEWVGMLRGDARTLLSAAARAGDAAEYLAGLAGRRTDAVLEEAA